MSTATSTPSTYSTSVQLMHWLSGGCMMACIGTVIQAQQLPKDKSAEKSKLMKIHKVL